MLSALSTTDKKEEFVADFTHAYHKIQEYERESMSFSSVFLQPRKWNESNKG